MHKTPYEMWDEINRYFGPNSLDITVMARVDGKMIVLTEAAEPPVKLNLVQVATFGLAGGGRIFEEVKQ